MTYEQALNFNQKWTAEQARNDLERYLLRDERPAYKAVAIGMQALKKQIPKKPFKEVIAKKNTRMVCPVCFVNLHYLVERQNYCPDCGQALDWGGTE